MKQLFVPRVLTLARRLADHVPGQPQPPYRDEDQEQQPTEEVAVADRRRDRRDDDEARAPRDVDDVVAADATPDRERGAVDQVRIARDAAETTTKFTGVPVGAKVHW